MFGGDKGELRSRKDEVMSEIHRKEGEELYAKEKYTKAAHAFSEALRLIPNDKKSLVWRSKCYSKLRRTQRAIDDIDIVLDIDSFYKEAMLQKADILSETGNYEMAMVYYQRGAKIFPKSPSFTDGLKRAEQHSTRTGRIMKMTSAGDISYFTHKTTQAKPFSWKKKPKDKLKHQSVPSAHFRERQVHPLVKVHKTPSVSLTNSRAPSMNSLLADSLESMAFEGKLLEEPMEKDALGKLYEDKQYLEFIMEMEVCKNNKASLSGQKAVADLIEDGLSFLQERTQFWDSLGPLPPPHPPRKSLSKASGSRLSHYNSTESLTSVGTSKSNSTWRSFKTNTTRQSKKFKPVHSRYAYGKRPSQERQPPPAPEKVKFEFTSYNRDDDLREMTQIPEEAPEAKRESDQELERRRQDALNRGSEVVAFVQKEITEIDICYTKGQMDICQKKANKCLDLLKRFSDEEVPTKGLLLSTLYSCLGNCAVQLKQYEDALKYHGQDLVIGEECELPIIQSRALGNLGRVHVLLGRYNRALDLYNRKAPLCTTSQETAWLFHEIGNCFLMMRIFEYALESGIKALRAAREGGHRRLQLQACVLIGVAEVNLGKYKEAYSHFEEALDHAKILEEKKAQDAMTQALVDVNQKIVKHMKKKKRSKNVTGATSPTPYNVTSLPVSLMETVTPHSTVSARTTPSVTVEG